MIEQNKSQTGWQDGAGFLGVALAVAGMWDFPTNARLFCVLGAAICFPLSFSCQKQWPLWVKWLLSLSVIGLAAFMGLFVLEG